MPSQYQTLDATMVVKEFVLVDELLDAKSADSPLQRWLEFQAYSELVKLAASEGALPDDHAFEQLDMSRVRDWIRGTRQLGFSFADRIKVLLLALKSSGSDLFDQICEFYCRYKNRLDAGFTGATMALGSAELASLLAQYKFDVLLFHGIPITSFASLAIKYGLLDDLCDCKTRLA